MSPFAVSMRVACLRPFHAWRVGLGLLLAWGSLAVGQSAGGGTEPTNAAEAAAKKAAEDQAVAARYRQWKATLTPAHQAWETVLEQNLGGFYFPLHQRDKLRGVTNAWDFVVDDPKLPRVLLIGDSVSRGYTLAARQALAGRANVHRAPENCGPTANGLKKLEVWLGDGKWDVIHFNFGIHDRATPPADYEERLGRLVQRLQATGARLVWASTTPIPPDTKDGPAASEAIQEKNRIAARLMADAGVAVNDLHAFITPHLADVQNPKDVHFKAAGYDLLGRQVAAAVLKALSGPGRDPGASAVPPRTIVVFGDSLTAGGALPAADRGQLWTLIVAREAKGAVVLVNEGKGGRPTAARPEFDAMLERQPRMDQLVIALGMNDSRDITDQCVPRAVANVRYMIEQARRRHGAALPVLLVGPSNINLAALGPTKSIGRERAAQLAALGAAFAQLAGETGCDFVSWLGVVPDTSLLRDGVHPDAAGNVAIARLMAPRLIPAAKPKS